MQTHRLTALVTAALTALLLQACNREAPVQSEPVSQAPSTETTTSIYDWHARGGPTGKGSYQDLVELFDEFLAFRDSGDAEAGFSAQAVAQRREQMQH